MAGANQTSSRSRISGQAGLRSGRDRRRRPSSSSAADGGHPSIQPIRLQFSDHPAALARGDIDAYVGAEPAPGISLANGTGRLVEYPYSTPIGSLNMILSASEKAVKDNPQRVQTIVDMHRKAVDYAMAHPEQIVEVAMQKLGQQKKSIELAVPNVELAWKIDDVFMQRANAYTQLMFENKQIRQMPDLSRYITKQFM